MSEASERIHEIKDEIGNLIREARSLVKLYHPSMLSNLDAYVFEQITEHLNKRNPYNSDLNDVANSLDFEEE